MRDESKLPVHMRKSFHAAHPTRFNLFLRTCLLWQVVRFVVLNLRMLKVIRLSHRNMH